MSQMATMKAEGLNNVQIGRALDVSSATIARALKVPENQIEVLRRRELLKGVSIAHVADVVDGAWDMARQAVANGDAKSFDATTRGLHAMEKIAASVSGENQRVQVEHSGTVYTGSAVEQLKILIGVITAP